MEATSQIAQTTLRAVLGQSSLDELLGGREKINGKLQAIIDRQTEPWGIKVGTVELKDAQLAESMVRALARQAEAEREKRAKIIATEGEFQAAQVLANAAEIISTQPAALALRYMQTLLDMGSNQNSTIVFPIPIELIRPLLAAPGADEDAEAVVRRVILRGECAFAASRSTDGFGELHVQRLQMFDDDPRNREVAKPLVVGRDDEPGRTGVLQRDRASS
jgi:hypothetical protein